MKKKTHTFSASVDSLKRIKATKFAADKIRKFKHT